MDCMDPTVPSFNNADALRLINRAPYGLFGLPEQPRKCQPLHFSAHRLSLPPSLSFHLAVNSSIHSEFGANSSFITSAVRPVLPRSFPITHSLSPLYLSDHLFFLSTAPHRSPTWPSIAFWLTRFFSSANKRR